MISHRRRYPGQEDPAASLELLDLLVGLIEYRDPYFRGSTSLTRHLCATIGRQLGMADDALRNLEVAALLRDLGRMALNGMLIPARAVPGDEERLQIERHVFLALELLERVDLPDEIRDAIRHHHENWDGSGYPDRLGGEQIPLGARVLNVADSFAAMISARPYRPPKRLNEAVAELRDGAGTLYDARVVEALLRALQGFEYGRAGFALHNHVLLVDPDEPRAVCLAVKLCSRGFLAEVVPNLETAQSRLLGVPCGAILLAGGLPDRASEDFISFLRSQSAHRSIPLVALDVGVPEERARLLRLGVDAAFSLFLEFDELVATLEALLRRTASRISADTSAQLPASLPPPRPDATDPGGSLQGSLRQFPLGWLLQAMQYDRRSAAIHLEGGEAEGIIQLQNGTLHHAESGEMSGEAALMDLLRWSDGGFRVQEDFILAPRTIHSPMMHLILEHARIEDESSLVFGGVPVG